MATAEQSRITARELALVALGAAVFAIVMNWPLILNLGSHIPLDLGDPLPQAWQVAWGGHALLHQPLHFFDANQFWPFHQTLAFSDALIGYAPAGLIGSGPARRRGPLRPALPVRLRAGVLRRLPARPRARPRARGGARGRRRLRVRAVPARAGRPPAGDLERRHPAGPRARGAGLRDAQPLGDARRLAGGALAGLARLQPRAPVRLPAPAPDRDRDRDLVPPRAAGARPPSARRGARGRARVRDLHGPAQHPLPARRRPLPAGDALAGGRRGLLRAARGLPLGVRGEPGLGPDHRRVSERPLDRPGEDAVPGPARRMPRDRRGDLARLAPRPAHRARAWA